MNEPRDGGPAFPSVSMNNEYIPGMNLRDYFAAQALAGLCGNKDVINGPCIQPSGSMSQLAKSMALAAYALADAMLAARNKP